MSAGELGRLAEEIVRASARIRPYVRETPLLDSASLSTVIGGEVVLKLEGMQRTGSFKVRGATNRLLILTPAERQRGVVAASSGNHGAAVAHAGAILGIPVTVFVPEGASSSKVAAMRASGAEVRVHGTDGLDAELEARSVSDATGMTYVSPYNDRGVIAGQGTLGVELRAQGPPLDAVVLAVGGGGLISGVGADLKTHWRDVEVIGAQPSNSPVMAASIRAGHVVELESRPTLSDGTAGGIEQDAITFPLCRALVDTWIEIPEPEIAAALHHCVVVERVLAEGAAAVAVAALRRHAGALHGKHVGVVLCGANISAPTLCSTLASVA